MSNGLELSKSEQEDLSTTKCFLVVVPDLLQYWWLLCRWYIYVDGFHVGSRSHSPFTGRIHLSQ